MVMAKVAGGFRLAAAQAGRPAIFDAVAVVEARQPGPMAGGLAHRARARRGIHGAAGKLGRAEAARRIADRAVSLASAGAASPAAIDPSVARRDSRERLFIACSLWSPPTKYG
jgi:hypothetical protein